MPYIKYIQMAMACNWTVKRIKNMFAVNSFVAYDYFQSAKSAEHCLELECAILSLAD